MGDRVPSDHDTVETRRVTVESVGRTDRLRVALPGTLDLSPDDIVRLSLDGDDYHARVRESLDGSLELRGAYTNERLAREDGEGDNRLLEWLRAAGLDEGRSVLLDELVAGAHYGLREPGSRVVYTVREPPAESLSDIADQFRE
jgi:hypothetical protein